MASDPALFEAYRKQCKFFGPSQALLLWWGSGEVARGEIERDDLIDVYKEVASELADAEEAAQEQTDA